MKSTLQSGTDYSTSGFNRRVASDRARIERHAADTAPIHANYEGTAMLLSTAYPPFEGAIENGPFLRIALAAVPSVGLVQHVDGARLEGLWRRGTIVISPPQSRGLARTGRTSMIGLAVLPPSDSDAFDLDHVTALASAFQDDALLVSVITALHQEAEVHGASTAFFDEGTALILRRLAELRDVRANPRKAHPLSDIRYERVRAYVEEHLAHDLPVTRLAQIAGLDSSGFTRAMRARTGLAPYAWLTQRRMERAGALLRSGLTVTQVAAMSGYANPGKFASAFRRVTGQAPSSWQKANENG